MRWDGTGTVKQTTTTNNALYVAHHFVNAYWQRLDKQWERKAMMRAFWIMTSNRHSRLLASLNSTAKDNPARCNVLKQSNYRQYWFLLPIYELGAVCARLHVWSFVHIRDLDSATENYGPWNTSPESRRRIRGNALVFENRLLYNITDFVWQLLRWLNDDSANPEIKSHTW